MFEVKDVKKSYKSDFWAKSIEALSNVSFSIKEGQIVGFLGANGAGKTTLIKIMMNFTRADSGAIYFFNNKNFSDISRNVGYLPERPYFYPHLTGLEMIQLMGALCDLSSQEVLDGVEKYGHRLRIHFALDRKIKGYSKGMLQRLGMLCTLIHNPKLIILDEPLSGLDPQGRKDIKDLLVELSNEGKTIFFSSHIVSDVEEVCEKVIVLEKGTIVYEGNISELIQRNSNTNLLISVNSKAQCLDNLSESFFSKNNITTYCVLENKKNEFLKMALDENIEVLKLSKNSPTLEEVVYKTGQNV